MKIIRAYCNSDPSITVSNQGFVYIISGLLHYMSESYMVFEMLIHLMLRLEWNQHYLRENSLDENPRVKELH